MSSTPSVSYLKSTQLIAEHNGYLVLGDSSGNLFIFPPRHGLQADRMRRAEVHEPNEAGEIRISAGSCVGDHDDLVFYDKVLKLETLNVGRREKGAFQIGVVFHDGGWHTDGKPRPVPDREKW